MNATLPPRPDRRTGLILLLGSLTAFPALSTDMYLPALPAIARDLGTNVAAVQTTLSVFFLGMALGQLVHGPLSDRFGRRRPLFAGIAVYVAASIACALATSVHVLWTARLAQALGGCAAVVIARASVRDTFDTIESARVFSRLVLVMGAAPILAPILGGQVLELASWRAIFWFLAAFGIAAFVAVWFRMPETHAGTPRAARPHVAAQTFVAILRDRTFLWPTLTSALTSGALFAYLVSCPAVLVEQYGVSPRAFGLFFAVNAIGIIGATQVNARLLRRVSIPRLLNRGVTTCAIAGLATLVVGYADVGGPWPIVVCWFAMMASLGFVGANCSARAMAHQQPRAGSAAALMGALQFGTGSIAGSLVAALTASPLIGTPARAAGIAIAVFTVAGYACSRLLPRENTPAR